MLERPGRDGTYRVWFQGPLSQECWIRVSYSGRLPGPEEAVIFRKLVPLWLQVMEYKSDEPENT